MKILLVNDDGFSAEGIVVLQRILLSRGHETWIFAPEGERSGFGHALTFHEPVVVRKEGDRIYSHTGYPADGVVYGIFSGIVPKDLDAVISGINKGPNLGSYIPSSGTCGGASEAAIHGYKALAVSTCYHEPDYTRVALFLADHLEEFLGLMERSEYLNVNIPREWNGEWRMAPLDPRREKAILIEATETEEGLSCTRSDGETMVHEWEEGSDRDLYEKGYITLTRIGVR